MEFRSVRQTGRRSRLVLGLVVGLAAAGGSAACGGRSATATAPAGSPEQAPVQPYDQENRRAPEDAAPGAETGARDAGLDDASGGAGPAPVTEAECQALLAHVVAIANAAHVQTVAPELAPTDEQLAEIGDRLAPRFLPACLRMDRRAFTCEMRAQSRDELLACAESP